MPTIQLKKENKKKTTTTVDRHTLLVEIGLIW